MYILDNACGWIPNAPIQFMYHIINLIKNLTPAVLIIMGSLDFGKAVMSQKDDEIKKTQGAFVKKLIAGAAVFFVVVFAKWVVQILQNAGVSDSNKAFNCVSLLLTGQYQQQDITYYEPPETTTTNTNTDTDSNICVYLTMTDYQKTEDGKECYKKTDSWYDCWREYTDKYWECYNKQSTTNNSNSNTNNDNNDNNDNNTNKCVNLTLTEYQKTEDGKECYKKTNSWNDCYQENIVDKYWECYNKQNTN